MRLCGYYPCPFCGSIATNIRTKSTRAGYNGADMPVDTVTASVRCGKCHARGGTASGKVIKCKLSNDVELPKWATTVDNIKQRAIDNWNRRAK